jgi:hypothetical protein
MAVFAHAFHNSFGTFVGGLEGFALGSLIDWFGWFVMAVFIIFMISRERGVMQRQLLEEVSSGVISQAQYQRALSPMTMSTSIFGGLAASRFYKNLGELAFKKEEYQKLGDEDGNFATIEKLRGELKTLAAQVRA